MPVFAHVISIVRHLLCGKVIGMDKIPLEIYVELMTTIRHRLDVIETIRQSQIDDFSRAETAAFHGRKIIEGISFACLVALENGIKHVPRDAKK